jgi:hypothetical protein
VPRPLHEYACIDVVASDAYERAQMGLHNALGCDAYPEELQAAARAAERLADQAQVLARRLREAGS